MAIRGELLSADLSNVFQMLALNRQRGGLNVQEQGNLLNRRRLYIFEDRVSLHEPPPDRPVVALLVEMGILTYPQYREVLDKSDRYSTDPIKLLSQQGVLEPDHLERVRARIEEEGILEVFLWRNISFELDEDAVPPADAEKGFCIDPLIMEAARRGDEWCQFVETAEVNRQIFILAGSSNDTGTLELPAIQNIVLDHVDGVRGSSEIVEDTGLPRYFVDLSLRSLQDAGHIESLGLSELITTGDRLVAEGHVAAGLRLYRTALRFDRRNLTLHKRIAGAWLQTGRIAKACAHYRFCAMSLLAAGKRRDSIAIYQNVLKLIPTDFRTLERCLELLSLEGPADGSDPERDDGEVLEDGRKLLNYFLDTAAHERAVALAERMLSLLPDDEDLLATVARLHLRLQHTEKAVAAYFKQAERRQEADDVPGAIEIYRSLSGIDPANRHIFQARIADLQRAKESKQGRRRRRLWLSVTTASVIALVGGYGAFAWLAGQALASADPGGGTDAETLFSRADAIEAAAANWPLTPAATTAVSDADKLRVRAETLCEKRRLAGVERTRIHDEGIAEANRCYVRALTFMPPHKVNLETALAEFGAAIEAADRVGGEWKPRADAEEKEASIVQYLEHGRAALKKGTEALDDPDLEVAFRAWSLVATEWYNLPELGGKTVTVPMRVRTVPADARIEVQLGGKWISGTGSLDVRVPHGSGPITTPVRYGKPGYLDGERELDPREGRWLVTFVLDKKPPQPRRVGEPLAALRRLADGSVALFARNGKSARLDPGSTGPIRDWHDPTAMNTVRVQPARSASGVLVASENGLFRFLDPVTLRTRWRRSLEAKVRWDRVLAPVPLGDGFVVVAMDKDGKNAHMGRFGPRDGPPLWAVGVPDHPLALAATSTGIGIVAKGGRLSLFDPVDPAKTREVSGTFSPFLGVDGAGRILAHRRDLGVVAIDPASGAQKTVIERTGGLTCAPVVIGGVLIAGWEGGDLVIGKAGDVTSLRVGEPVTNVITGPGAVCAVRLKSGRILVLDTESRSFRFGVRGSPTSDALQVVTGAHLVVGFDDGRIVTVSME
ncbi:MAG: hypothetical protein CMJ83_17220 [Planctomycetes bacterium]|nr:hypothetical protein [Planctomycetota bacterium]